MTTRGEGLADILGMKREFEKYQIKFQKLGNRVDDLEEANALIRNLDLDMMVTPERLEDRLL